MCAAVAQYLVRSGDVWNRTCMQISISVYPRSCKNSKTYCNALSCISMDSDAVMVSPRFGGDFSGDEKMPEMGSKPCASYTPRSSSVMPVFLQMSVLYVRPRSSCFAYLPCTPTL